MNHERLCSKCREQSIAVFELKYDYLPGDCANATQLGIGPNGDGNGYVDGLAINKWYGGVYRATTTHA